MVPDTEVVKDQLVSALQTELDKSRLLIASLKSELKDTRAEHSIQKHEFKRLAFEATIRDFKINQQQETIDKHRNRETILVHDIDNLSRKITTLSDKLKIKEDIDHVTNHDIRSAIATWLNTTDILLAEPGLSQEGIKILREARASGTRILSFIDMNLSLFKIERGGFKIELVTINAVDAVTSIIYQNKKIINDKQISLPPPVGAHGDVAKTCNIYGNESLTHIILNNLLVNAIEASPVGAEIKITFERNDHCKISIHNFGEVPEQIRGEFFDKFVTSGKRNGTGIGTYSSLLMAKAQNGDVVADFSEPGATTITIKFQKPPVT